MSGLTLYPSVHLLALCVVVFYEVLEQIDSLLGLDLIYFNQVLLGEGLLYKKNMTNQLDICY